MEPSERVELALFNAAVDAWGERFTPDKMRRFAFTIGKPADKVFHTHYMSWRGLMDQYYRMYGRPIGRCTVGRYIKTFEALGIITVTNRKQGADGEYPGANMSNLYTIDFRKVLVAGRVVDHDFYAPVRTEIETSVESWVET